MRLPAIARAAAVAVTAGLVCAAAPLASAATSVAPVSMSGTLADGSAYVIEAPSDWNGTLLVYSPGYGGAYRAPTLGASPALKAWLLEQGYALAGASKPGAPGWGVADLLAAQPQVVQVAAETLGEPEHVVAWGDSMGGLTSAALMERSPDVFDGAIPLCGSVAGTVPMLNQGLDATFAFKTLLAPDNDALSLVNVTSEPARQAAARAVIDEAQKTPQGRARIALAAAYGQIPGWAVAGSPEPAKRDFTTQQEQQYAMFLWGAFSPRQPLEARAGSNFSWNTGVDYALALERSGNAQQVRALYAAAGLDLKADLATLAAAPRISADPAAVQYMLRNATPAGDIEDPVLTLHESGDLAPTVTQARAYADAVRSAGNASLLRQAFVDRPGHCGYSDTETAAMILAMQERLDTGRWADSATPRHLNALATQVGREAPTLSSGSGFTAYRPNDMLRPYYPDETR